MDLITRGKRLCWELSLRTKFEQLRRNRPLPGPRRFNARPRTAYLSFDEGKRGSIAVGKFADLAVLSADPLTVEESGIRDITSLMTIVGGRVVYEAA